jgi:sphingomyelin phosphodiesterase
VPDSYNIIQITDWHVDFNYLEGTNKKCNYEICCQKEWGMAETPSEAARKYGELTCDIPYITAVK